MLENGDADGCKPQRGDAWSFCPSRAKQLGHRYVTQNNGIPLIRQDTKKGPTVD